MGIAFARHAIHTMDRSTPSMSTAAKSKLPATTHAHSDAEPGCEHIAALSHSQLKQLLKRYSLGIRWGKRVRRGLVQTDQDQEQDEYDAERAAYHGETSTRHADKAASASAGDKRRKVSRRRESTANSTN